MSWQRKVNEMIPNDILLNSRIIALFKFHQRGFIQHLMRTDGEACRKPFGGAQRTPRKSKRRVLGPRGSRKLGEHDLWNKLNNAHGASQRVKQQA